MPRNEPFVIDSITYAPELRLGQGGSATVWKVRRQPDDAVFALKQIAKDPKDDSARNKRFEREIAYGQASEHPNLLRIRAASEDEVTYRYVMDFYPMTLRDVIDGESDPDVLFDYALQLCAGVAHVHADDIVHRDIKPENILIDPDAGRLVLADFGIAHFKDSALTRRNDLLANRNYLAPEQMRRHNARHVDKPADIFALGLVITEMFTKENPRGRRHTLIRDRYPLLADLDPIVERMMLQAEEKRLRIDTVWGLLRLMRQRLDGAVAETADGLRLDEDLPGTSSEDVERTLDRAARDILSAKHIFERVAEEDLGRYNINYHCEISYDVSAELFNACAQAAVYSLCKAKFTYEGAGSWDAHDDARVSSATKTRLQDELDAILAAFPLPRNSHWAGLPRQSSHLFRFCKDYHCEELLTSIRELLYGEDHDALPTNVRDAPILWIVRSLHLYLSTDYLAFDRAVREEIQLEQHLSVRWDDSLPSDPAREATGAELFRTPFNAARIADALLELESNWNVSAGELIDGEYSVIFGSRDDYLRFREEALAQTEVGSVFEADVLQLLRPEAEDEDLVALTWDRDFDVAITLGKVLGTRTREPSSSTDSSPGRSPSRSD